MFSQRRLCDATHTLPERVPLRKDNVTGPTSTAAANMSNSSHEHSSGTPGNPVGADQWRPGRRGTAGDRAPAGATADTPGGAVAPRRGPAHGGTFRRGHR